MRLHRFAPLLIIAGSTPADAQTPSDLADLIGARGAGGESELQQRGYVFVRTRTGDDRKWSNWWHPARRQCLSVVTVDGRYASITATPAPDCDQRASAAGADRPGGGYRPNIGYRPIAPQVGAPSYADRDLGRTMATTPISASSVRRRPAATGGEQFRLDLERPARAL